MSNERILGISAALNLALLAGLTFLLVGRHETGALPRVILSEAKPKPLTESAAVPVPPAPPEIVTRPFYWRDLESSNGYRGFIANLRAIGCPESSISDIVRGNVGRAFSWERSRLHLDGSGNGPWSQTGEIALINDLMGNSTVSRAALYSQNPGARPAEIVRPGAENASQDNSQIAQLSGPQSYSQNAQATASSSWLARGGAWNNAGPAAGVSANQSSGGQGQQSDAIGVSQQNFGSGPQTGGDPNSPPEQGSGPTSSANDQGGSNDPFTKSAQDIMADQLAQYYDWYAPQVKAAAADNTGLFINPDAFRP